MPIRKLINDRIAHIDAQIEAHVDEKNRLIEQLNMFNTTAFAYGDPALEHGTPEKEAIAVWEPNPLLIHEAAKAPRKPRVESGRRRTGLKDEVLQHIMTGDGTISIKDMSRIVNAKMQSVKAAIESLVKADKIAPSGNGGYHPVESAA
jgi:hypothetical protein